MPRYEEIRDQFKTGDIILFSGKGAFSSMIKLFSGGKWSHIGMVIRLPDFDDAVLLWESTTLTNTSDVEFNSSIKGVQLVALSERISRYAGEISLRPLNKPINESMYSDLSQLRHKLSRRPYERDELELLRSAWDGIAGANSEDLSSVFCSELVAEAYQSMGLLPEPPVGLPSNEYTPLDFSEARELKLQGDYRLKREISIT
ncbi:C40 family peptidase [Gimesia aquarii]|uniref:Permuted papain-like amidase enzyme, YaeF/YiiX, C92 family n=1 Tax=Gimesia aquarii TaxID=2527964 RepID=A0A517W093_9PLAN|nr:hypothetical protein [Gimesia aquarii]QDT98675.1 hypothetical protein V144x_41820 [Gimesia aquarii]